jgi:hypothetical protein
MRGARRFCVEKMADVCGGLVGLCFPWLQAFGLSSPRIGGRGFFRRRLDSCSDTKDRLRGAVEIVENLHFRRLLGVLNSKMASGSCVAEKLSEVQGERLDSAKPTILYSSFDITTIRGMVR